MSNSNDRLLWISNIPKSARASDLKKLLAQFGKVKRVKILINAKFPGACCFGYVAMASADHADNVIGNLNNTEFCGHIITIDKFEDVKSADKDLLQLQVDGNSVQNKSCDKSSEISSKPNESKSIQVSDVTTSKITTNTETETSPVEVTNTLEVKSPVNPQLPTPVIRPNPSILTFHKIKEERERQKRRDRERALRDDVRRRNEEASRLKAIREIAMEQRKEAKRLEYERERLQFELYRFEREKNALYKKRPKTHERTSNSSSTSNPSTVERGRSSEDFRNSKFNLSVSQSTI